ncbi:branched-chain amino acid ABC transporter permease [Paraburkholderia tuberum]|uniref:branched-chain amino acid ABC transporter permease n=1 Tax=Paraburkholderia TaxID=1822464 RepID=UPI0003658C65|nr:branched-chain amino acid ABC transporter permease [Paraburkholderia tuberum]
MSNFLDRAYTAQRAVGVPFRLCWAGLFVVAAGVLFVGNGYQLFQATMLLAYAVSLLGLNLLTGYNGQISLGHGAFFGIGAYTVAILMDRLGLPYWLVVPLAGIVSLVIGYAFAWPALKLDGIYLALATFGLGVATPQLLKCRLLEQWTGGVQGIAVIKPEVPLGLPLSQDQWLFLYAVLICAIVFWMANNLLRGAAGRSMRAIRDHALAAEATGLNIASLKTKTFALSAAYTGVGGALSALAVQFVAPDSFSMFLSITLLVGIVVGGVGTLWGAAFGAVFIMVIPAFSESVSKSAPWVVYGVLLIVSVYVLPGGIAALGNRYRLMRSHH